MNINTEQLSVPKFLQLFEKFSAEDKMKIADQIDRETFESRWKALDSDLPDVDMSDEEIMAELRAERYSLDNER